ncbi:MAG: hypothetical protein J0L75_10825 [Spirochaetes bacterium]|nr:hypothetical protein [Spirochaetota bacterium]
MPTIPLDFTKVRELQPAHALWKAYRPGAAPHAFRAGSLAAALAWQKKTRAALSGLLGVERGAKAALAPRRLERVERPDHIREKWVLTAAPGSRMPVYLVLPKGGRGPFPVVLGFHGHGYGAKDVVGLREDGSEKPAMEGYHKDFALSLARLGIAVAVPEISCFGERRTDFSSLTGIPGRQAPSTCFHTSMLASHLGKTSIGMRVGEAMRLVDWLGTRSEIDAARLGAMGISGGGMHAFYSAMLDTRIRACVVSGYFCTFRDSIFAMNHCACNFIPGMGAFGEMHDLAALIAPRPMLVESGEQDPIFPRSAVVKAVNQAKRAWKRLGAPGYPQTDYYRGGHEISGVKAFPFLERALK